MPKVIAFDLFGTVFDLSGVDRDEVRAYVEHVRKPKWSPLELPESWKELPAFPDAATGIWRLIQKFQVVTLSNAPQELQVDLLHNARIGFHYLVPLERFHVYKPNPRAYMAACVQLETDPADILMVTANEDFGDLEGAKAVGMESMLIRSGDGPKTIIELAELLGP